MKYQLFVILIFFIACTKESTEFNLKAEFCLDTTPSLGISPNDIDSDFTTKCNGDFTIDSSNFCEVIQKETLLLENTAKCWIPQYQYDIGKIFTYNNASGQSINLRLSNKGHLLVNRITEGERCELDSTKRVGHCNEIELYYISLIDSENEIEYYIEMRTRMIPFDDIDIFSPELLIVAVLSQNDARGALLYDKEFDATELLYMHTEFSENKTLLNRTFSNVICNARPIVNKAYYNKEIGLLGFEDDSEVLWVIEE